jgi:hypothetical protein
MAMTSRPLGGVDRDARSDARLGLGAVVAAAAGFVLFVLLPYGTGTFDPPAGLDILWRVGGPLNLVLAPVAAGCAGVRSSWVLWAHRDLDDATRRTHLIVLVLVVAFIALLASPPGRAAAAWWQD